MGTPQQSTQDRGTMDVPRPSLVSNVVFPVERCLLGERFLDVLVQERQLANVGAIVVLQASRPLKMTALP